MAVIFLGVLFSKGGVSIGALLLESITGIFTTMELEPYYKQASK